jgi:hypothetical protein
VLLLGMTGIARGDSRANEISANPIQTSPTDAFISSKTITIAHPERSEFSGKDIAITVFATPSGLATERVPDGTEVKTIVRSYPSGDWTFVRIIRGDGSSSCAWAETQVLSSTEITSPDDVCRSQIVPMQKYHHIGKDINCHLSVVHRKKNCVGAARPKPVSADCDRSLYGRNISEHSGFSNIQSPLADPGPSFSIGQLPKDEKVGFRYERNGLAMIKSVTKGWLWIDGDCIPPQHRHGKSLHKKPHSQPGAHPNGGQHKSNLSFTIKTVPGVSVFSKQPVVS